MKKIYSLFKSIALLVSVCVISLHDVDAQCNLTTYQSGAAAPVCNTYQSVSGGAGAYWQVNLTNLVLYSFYWNGSVCPDATEFCAGGNLSSNTSSTSPFIVEAVGGTGLYDIGINQDNTTWCGNSAVLNYKITSPVVNTPATTSATVCATQGSYTVNGYTYTIGGYSGYGSVAWTASSTAGIAGSISNSATETPTYNFTPAEVASGATVTLTMTADNGGCTATGTFTLVIKPAPTATQGGVSTGSVCANAGSYTVPSGYGSANGTILWTASSSSGTTGGLTGTSTLTPTYTFSPADVVSGATVTLTMTVSDGGTCTPATTTFVLTVKPVPTATQGATHIATVCALPSSYTIPAGYASTNGTITWTASSTSGTNGTITNGSTLTPTYNFSTADIASGATVTLTMTVANSPCTAATTNFVLTINPIPTATQGATSTATACASANFYTIPSGYGASNGTISWSATTTSGTLGTISNGNTLTPTYTFSAADKTSGATVVLTMTVSDAPCTAASTSFTLTVTPAPIATQGATSSASACVSAGSYTVPSGYSSANGTVSWSASSNSGTTGTVSNGSTLTPTYTFSPADVTSGATVTLTMSVSDGGTCAPATTTFTLSVLKEPTATQGATSSATACANASFYTVPAGYSAANGTISWSASTTSGTLGSISNGTTLTPTYNFSAADVASGATVTLTMTVDDGGVCSPATTTFTLTITQLPVATQGATNAATACVTAGSYTVPSGYAANGNITWTASSTSGTTGTLSNANTLTPTYSFSAADQSATSPTTVTLTMTVDDGGICPTNSTTFALTIDPLPTATAGATSSGTACANASFYTIPAGYSSSNGTVTWTASSTSGTTGSVVNPNTLTPTYNFSAADIASGATVTLTMTVADAGVCSPATTSFTLTIDQLPAATQGATSSATACVSAGSYTVPSGYAANGNITWTASSTSGTAGTISNANTLTPTYNFSAADIAATSGPTTVTLTMTVDDGGVCPTNSTTFTLTIDPLPTATPPVNNSVEVCANSNFYTIPSGYSATNGSITWTATSTSGTVGSILNPNTLTPTYNFSAADISSGSTVIMTMTVDDGGVCSPATTTFEIDIYPLPSATAGATTSAAVCASTNSYTIPAGYQASNGGILWTAVSTSATTGTVNNSSSLTPTYVFSQDDSLSGATVTLTLTVDDDLICPDANATFTLTIYPDPTPATAGSQQNICGSFISGPLGGNTPAVGTGTWSQVSGTGVTFFSSINAGNSTASVTAPGIYVFAWTIATGGGACTSVAYDTVNYYAAPTTATAGATQNICGSLTSDPLGGNNPSVGIGTWTQISGPGTTTFSYPDSGASTATVTALGSYTYQWTISNGTCAPSSATVTVNFISSPSGGTIANASYCSSTGSTTVSVTGASSANQYVWALPAGLSGSSTTSSIIVGGTVPGTYTVTATPQNTAFGVTCTGAPITGTVTILSLPVVDSVHSGTVTCFGGSNDTITVFATSSNGNLQYSINGGSSYPNATGVFPGLGAGNYDVYVKDDSGCSSGYGANPIHVTAPSTALSAASVVTTVKCAGDSNGSINLLASGGVGGYIYTWSSGQDIQIISGLPAGIYVGSVTDDNGCVATVTDTLLSPPVMTSDLEMTGVSCYGGNNGQGGPSVAGGVPPYTYLWTNDDTAQYLFGLTAGQYGVVITDAYGCKQIDTATVYQPAALTATVAVRNVACNGANNGSVVVTVTGGTSTSGTYSYTWSPISSSTDSVSGVGPGTYTVTASDDNSCSVTASGTVTQPLSALSISADVSNVKCHNDANGTISVLANGGVGGYTYSWSGGQTTAVITDLPAGSYTVTVTDANGCTASLTETLTNPATMTAHITKTNVTCYGSGDGTADLTVSGGVAPYAVLWSNFETSFNLSRLSEGLYRVVITDSNGCQLDDSVRIRRPALLTGTLSVTNVACYGSNIDSIVVTATGGNAGGYQYTWSPSLSTTNAITDVAPGQYNVTVTDTKGCTFTDSAVITQPSSALSISATVDPITCSNTNNGSISVLASGGIGGYTYSWATGQTISAISGLAAGPYTVTVTDGNGCSASLTETLTNPSAIISSIVGTNVTCAGASNGSATLTVSGGTPGYTYLWSNFDTTQNLSNIAGGTYRVVITDASGCRKYDSVVITEPLPLTATVAVTNVACNGANSGSVVATVSGGTPGVGGYSYTWSPVTSTTDSVSSVGPGTYTVTASDANLCSVTASGTVTQPLAPLAISADVSNITCNNADNGSISILTSGGVGGYTYSWATGQATSVISSLSAGAYAATVTDANGCTASLTETLTNPTVITSSIVGTNVTCSGSANGSATLTVSGGTPGYTYLWSNFDTTKNLSNVIGGLYRVIITDANGCRNYDSIIITEPLALTTSIAVRNVSCFGAANGSVVVTVSGGTPGVGGFSYSWSPVASTTDSVSAVGPGTYTVTATDANLCSVTASGTVTQPASALSVLSNVVNVSCGGNSDGSITLSVNGGTPSYTYTWSTGQHTQNITSLSAGIYTVTVSDVNGCSVVVNDTVKAPVPIVSSVTGTNVTCAGADNGSATLTVSGGTLPYSFLWSNFSGAQNIDSLTAGWYYVIITDGYGCQKRDSVKILSPLPLVLTDTVSPVSCTNGTDGFIHVLSTGGTGAAGSFTYTWSPSGPNSANNNNLAAGTYAVTVADANGCTASISATLSNPAPLTIAYGVTEPRCFGDNNGSINIVAGGGTTQYAYTWNPGGPNTADNTNLTAGTYVVTVTDSRGCQINQTIVLNQPNGMYISGIKKDISCYNLNDGYILPTGYGGTQPYSYQWYLGTDTFAPQGPITANITQLSGGSYYLVITDANGCMAPLLEHIVNPDSLIVTLHDSNASCYGSNTGYVLASVTGGTVPYQYLWNNFTTDSIQRNIGAGTYTVVVTDSNGCHQNQAITVTQSPAITVSTADVDPTCNAATNGSITLTVSGGRPTYTYDWNTSPAQTTSAISGLTAGTYIVTVSDLSHCTVTDTVVLTAPSPLEVNTAISNPTCSGGDNGFISLDVRGGSAPYSYDWSTTPAQAGNVANTLAAGTYYATITDAHSCVLLDTAVVVSPLPVDVTISTNSSTCPGNAVGIVVVSATGGLAPYNYSLGSLTQTSDTFMNLSVGTYSAVVTDVNGCHGEAPITIGVAGSFTDTLTATPDVILAGEIVHLYARAASDTTITSYIWYPADSLDFSTCGSSSDCDSPTVRPTQTQIYVVEVVNARGCRLRDTVLVTVSNQPSVFIPQAFSPNGDHLNDLFEFDILGATTVNVQIWNRWGELVYSNPAQPNGINNIDGWNGTYNGQPAAFDTYTYQFVVTYYDGHQQTMTGTVTLVR